MNESVNNSNSIEDLEEIFQWVKKKIDLETIPEESVERKMIETLFDDMHSNLILAKRDSKIE